MQQQEGYRERIANSKSLFDITQIAKDYGISARAMNELLHALGVQYKVNGQWVLYSKYQNCGYTGSKMLLIAHSNGSDETKLHTGWTPKGMQFIRELLAQNGIFITLER